jgi:hypothetical protein
VSIDRQRMMRDQIESWRGARDHFLDLVGDDPG